MFETLDTMISLGVIFLILSMVNKYLVSLVKRFFQIKAKTISKEMKTFVGENTTQYLIPYLEKKAKHLNFLDNVKGENVLRELDKEQLAMVVSDLKEFLKDENTTGIMEVYGIDNTIKETKEKIDKIKNHLETLEGRIEKIYDNTMKKISEMYVSNLRTFTLYSGLALALIINANFFEIFSTISNNSLVRDKLVAQADVVHSQFELVSQHIALKEKEEIKSIKKEMKDAEKYIADLTGKIEDSGISLGWTVNDFEQIYTNAKENVEKTKFKSSSLLVGIYMLLDVLSKLIGLCIAGLLIGFGAPFWHDFIGTFTGIRKTLMGKKEVISSGTSSLPKFDDKQKNN